MRQTREFDPCKMGQFIHGSWNEEKYGGIYHGKAAQEIDLCDILYSGAVFWGCVWYAKRPWWWFHKDVSYHLFHGWIQNHY
jgi:hypothetical protein